MKRITVLMATVIAMALGAAPAPPPASAGQAAPRGTVPVQRVAETASRSVARTATGVKQVTDDSATQVGRAVERTTASLDTVNRTIERTTGSLDSVRRSVRRLVGSLDAQATEAGAMLTATLRSLIGAAPVRVTVAPSRPAAGPPAATGTPGPVSWPVGNPLSGALRAPHEGHSAHQAAAGANVGGIPASRAGVGPFSLPAVTSAEGRAASPPSRSPLPELPRPPAGGGAASTGLGSGPLAALVAALALLLAGPTRRLRASPVLIRPAPFVSLLERPG